MRALKTEAYIFHINGPSLYKMYTKSIARMFHIDDLFYVFFYDFFFVIIDCLMKVVKQQESILQNMKGKFVNRQVPVYIKYLRNKTGLKSIFIWTFLNTGNHLLTFLYLYSTNNIYSKFNSAKVHRSSHDTNNIPNLAIYSRTWISRHFDGLEYHAILDWKSQHFHLNHIALHWAYSIGHFH